MNNKKIAIFTIQSRNYGNRLQNYAVQHILTELGYDAYTIPTDNFAILVEKMLQEHSNLSFLKPFFPAFILFRKMKWLLHDNFTKFNRKIKFSKDLLITTNALKVDHAADYFAFVVGSDQIWNTTFPFVSKNYFLPFKHERKIALSASFGLDDIPYDQDIRGCISEFKKISVRETTGQTIVNQMINKTPEVLIDPTLVLTKEKWTELSHKPKGFHEGYVLTYFLSPKCNEALQLIDKVRGSKQVYEISVDDDSLMRNVGPSEFLWLFRHADLVLTDSFHASIFSFLFNKPFLVYDRNWKLGNMNSRLNTFLSTFSLERKYVGSGLKNDLWEHDYSIGLEQLEKERKKVLDFLKNALE